MSTEKMSTENKNSSVDWIFPWTTFFFPPELDPVLMCDAQCAETNQKSIFDFYLSSYREKFNENWGQK